MQAKPATSDITNLIETSWRIGYKLDLSGCCYGEPHWDAPFVSEPSSYYFFLAGLAKQLHLKRVLEVGTHWGGAIKSMIRGAWSNGDTEGFNYVTADITYHNHEGFSELPEFLIKRIHGDIAKPESLAKVEALFGKEPIDLLFIDADHSYEGTSSHINLLLPLVRPKLMILDDIHLNDSMEKLWQELTNLLPDRCYDCTKQSGRGPSGFGLIITG